jgi:monoamine oxidase
VPHTISRRKFLERIGAYGGSAAVYGALTSMGLLPRVARAAPPALAPLGSARRSVVILGAGISGLVSAYELLRAGYDVTVLEASHRAGGRNLTVRHGDLIDEVGNPQRCEFDDEPHLYFNCGPARLPADHTGILHYCRELGVDLELFVNDNRNAWVHDTEAFGGKPVRARRFIADARGFLAELTSKNLLPQELDTPLLRADLESLRGFVRAFGDLDDDGSYHGSSRAGYARGGFVTRGEHNEPLDPAELLKAGFLRGPMNFMEGADQAAPMMQPVGGMDRIPAAFVREVGHRIRLQAMVKRIQLRENGVRVVWDERGTERVIDADYCLNCIPAWLATGLDHNFPADYAEALGSLGRGALFKIGFQTTERFWEKERIYGGISWTNQPITQIWYPPHNIFGKNGVILGAYTFGPSAGRDFARMSPPERLEAAIQQGEQIHPDYRKYIKTGVSIPWYRMNHMLGCSARMPRGSGEAFFSRIQQPAGRHYMIGDQISYHSGWQEGAVRSAHWALAHLDSRVRAELGRGAA